MVKGTFKKIKLTIGTKLVGLIAGLLVLSVTSLVLLATRMFTEDNMAMIQQMNSDTTGILATQMRELFEGTTEKMRVLGSVLMQDFSSAASKDRVTSEFFSKDKNFLALYVNRHADDGSTSVQTKAVSPELKGIDDPVGDKALAAVQNDKNFSLAQVAKGEIQLASVKLVDGSPAIAIAFPFIQVSNDKFSHSLLAFIRQSHFSKAFTEVDTVTSYMVDRNGRLLAHPDAARAAAAENLSQVDIVKELLEGKTNNKQKRFIDNGEAKLGAFKMVGFAGLGVVAEVPEAKAFDSASRVKYRSMLFGFTILCLAFFLGFFYSSTITTPIRNLVDAARKISAGDFAINLRPKGNDEVAQLSVAFNDMAKGLEERDRVKETFNKFHNKEIADKLLSGEVKLGGERKIATVFFSDVRGFTAMSESMEPEQVVEMLNEYMTRMVAIIRTFGGVVDKYVGDAIMAIWGVPLPKPDDTFNAVAACIAMREELSKLNELRISRGQSVLKIGMGLNTGQVIAGNIGSVEKMEYTVIGDTVNLASRVESMTKEYGTDLLISKNVYEYVKEEFIVEACKAAKVKGKSDAIEIFKVRGFYDENGKEIIVETPYSSYASEKSDKAVHDDADPEPQAETTSAPVEVSHSMSALSAAHDTAPAFSMPAEASAPATTASPATEFSFDAPIVPVEPVIPGVSGVHQTFRDEPAVAAPTAVTSHATKQWYIQFDTDVYGPFTYGEVFTGIRSNELTAQMKAATSLESQDWVALSDYPEFKTQFENIPKAA